MLRASRATTPSSRQFWPTPREQRLWIMPRGNPRLRVPANPRRQCFSGFQKQSRTEATPGQSFSIASKGLAAGPIGRKLRLWHRSRPTWTVQRSKEIRGCHSTSDASVTLPSPGQSERQCAVWMGTSCARSVAFWHIGSIPAFLVTCARSIIAYLCPKLPARLPLGLKIWLCFAPTAIELFTRQIL